MELSKISRKDKEDFTKTLYKPLFYTAHVDNISTHPLSVLILSIHGFIVLLATHLSAFSMRSTRRAQRQALSPCSVSPLSDSGAAMSSNALTEGVFRSRAAGSPLRRIHARFKSPWSVGSNDRAIHLS